MTHPPYAKARARFISSSDAPGKRSRRCGSSEESQAASTSASWLRTEYAPAGGVCSHGAALSSTSRPTRPVRYRGSGRVVADLVADLQVVALRDADHDPPPLTVPALVGGDVSERVLGAQLFRHA